MKAQAMGWTIISEFHSVARHDPLVALDVAGFEGIMCMMHKSHLVVCDAIGLGSTIQPIGMQAPRRRRHSWRNGNNCWSISHAA